MSTISPLKDQILPIGRSCIKQALASLHRTDGMDCRACAQLLHHCYTRRLVRQGKQIHARIVLHSIIPDNYLASSLLTFYSKSDHIVDARNVFDRIPNPNAFSCNAMLIAYSHHNQHLQLLHLFSNLVNSPLATALKPDNFTMTSVLKSLSLLWPDPCWAREAHGYVLRRGFESDVFVANALITVYGKVGELGSARKLFDGTDVRDVVTWNSMLAGYSQGGLYEECLGLYREMVGGGTGLRPNAVTMMSVLQACAQLQDLVSGMEVHGYIVESKMEVDVFVDNSIVGLYAKCGSLDYARELFDDMKVRDQFSYGSMISGYMVHGQVDKAMELFREIENPSLSTWNAVVSGLVQNNQYEDTHKLVQEMQAKGCRPNAVTLSSVLPSFSHFSNLKPDFQTLQR